MSTSDGGDRKSAAAPSPAASLASSDESRETESLLGHVKAKGLGNLAFLSLYALMTLVNRVFLSLQYAFTPYALFVNLWWTIVQAPVFWLL